MCSARRARGERKRASARAHPPPPPARSQLLGFWYDYDLKVTPGDRYVCTCVLTLDAASGGKKLDAALKTKEGGSEAWTAQRFNLASAVPRTDGKMTAFAFKDKAIFDRVSDNLVAKKAAWVEAERVTALAESVPRRNFDGALEYIPGPGAVGAEYMTQHDIDRMLAAREDGHRARAIASWEAKIEALKAKVAAGADDLKPKLALAERLLKGEHGAEKLKERAPFKPALSGFAPAGEEKPPRGPDEYATFYEVMRAMDKADRERNKTELAALEEALPKAEAALAAGGGDADKLKKAVETTKKAIKGLKGLLLMEERPKFKPTSSDPTVVSGKHAEYMPVRAGAAARAREARRAPLTALLHPPPPPRRTCTSPRTSSSASCARTTSRGRRSTRRSSSARPRSSRPRRRPGRSTTSQSGARGCCPSS